MPIYGQCNGLCHKLTQSQSKGSGVRRIRAIGLGFTTSTLENKYVPGSGVGVVSTANRRALLRRAASKNACDCLN